eukprot:scaffold48024_cov57-Phaeocystis_antarctica.AAC.4
MRAGSLPPSPSSRACRSRHHGRRTSGRSRGPPNASNVPPPAPTPSGAPEQASQLQAPPPRPPLAGS